MLASTKQFIFGVTLMAIGGLAIVVSDDVPRSLFGAIAFIYGFLNAQDAF